METEVQQRESYEELYDRIVKPIIPLNEYIDVPAQQWFDPQNQIREIIEQNNRNQQYLIEQLKRQVEDLTRIVNVLAVRPIQIDRRKFPIT